MALNKIGVSFLDLITHETMLHYPFTEVISTRKVQTDDGTLYLDMKCGKFGFVRDGCPRVKAPLYFYPYNLVAVTSSGILKAKQKLGVSFNSDKLGSIDFMKFSKLTMCRALEA